CGGIKNISIFLAISCGPLAILMTVRPFAGPVGSAKAHEWHNSGYGLLIRRTLWVSFEFRFGSPACRSSQQGRCNCT
ncbi:uncharacterized protein EI90DRAFT_3049296, partial [Cantharellus anzutake]|uniref:uncharacterized protein n=1 Tax=Cantharellus anzutake TaxID=1750568 RepID=UPI0019059BF5